jgi:nucleotide-binding universal stress UspA family protein
MYDRIVVPLDGSVLAEAALPHAKNLAKQNGVPLFLVRAIDPPLVNTVSSLGMRPTFGMTEEAHEEETRAAHEYIDSQVESLSAEGFKASGVVMWGNATSAVASTLNDADLLVMSSHGRTGPKRWFVGSVAEDILKRSSVPVFLVRQPVEGT